MRFLAAILFAVMLAATYAGGPAADVGGEESGCCKVCSCCLEEAPASNAPAVPSAPLRLSHGASDLLTLPRGEVISVVSLDDLEREVPTVSSGEPLLVCPLPLFRRDCALLI